MKFWTKKRAAALGLAALLTLSLAGAGHRGRDTHRRGRSGQGLGGPGVGGWLLGSAHGTRRG